MNLYAILFQHFSQKDSEKGIYTYLLANSDEEVYEWLKSNPTLKNGEQIHTNYKDSESDGDEFDLYDEEYNVIGTEKFKDKMIRFKGDYNDEDAEVSDLYYGATLLGWKFIKESITSEQINLMSEIGIDFEIYK